MKHLVTGGGGFLGSHIARRLASGGSAVRLMDIREPRSPGPGTEFIRASILDRNSVREALRGVDVVHHTASLVPVTKAGGNFFEVNVTGSRILAEEAVRAGVRCFVHMSSTAVFGAPERVPLEEDSPMRPVEIFGRTKMEGEAVVGDICRRNGVPLIVLRPRTVLGKGRMGVFQILFEWISSGRNIYTIGDGNVLFQFIHVDDLLNAYMLLLKKEQTGIFNVGADRFGTLREALERLVRYAGTSSRVKALPVHPTIAALRLLDFLRLSPLAPWHYLTYHTPFFVDSRPLLQLGWKPVYSNDEMLRESYEWYLAHRRSREELSHLSPHCRPVKERILWALKKMS